MTGQPEPEAPRRQRPSRWHRPVWWANGLAALLLLLTCLAPHVSPAYFWPLALLAMSFPWQLPFHLGFIAYWAVFHRRRALLSLLVLLVAWGHVGDHYRPFGRGEPSTEVSGTPVKLMSWNVRLFDLYNWSGNKGTRDAIFAMLHREDPGILCLQEFFHSPDPRFFPTKDALLGEFRYGHSHIAYSATARQQQHFGIATFSAWPIVAKGQITFPDSPNNQCIWSDIAIGGDTVRVYNAHLASYHFGDEDHKFIAELDTDTKGEALRDGGLRILRLLRRGLRLRAGEVERIAEHVRQSPHPVVYCGDMNDVPMSYSYHRLRATLRDAFAESGRGTGGTYIGKLPSLRIDHLMHGPELESWAFTTHPEELSDHRAISCMVALRGD